MPSSKPLSVRVVAHRVASMRSAPTCALLETASMAGAEFSAALMVVDGMDAWAAEASCATLARRGRK
jgi:hypothetical protein